MEGTGPEENVEVLIKQNEVPRVTRLMVPSLVSLAFKKGTCMETHIVQVQVHMIHTVHTYIYIEPTPADRFVRDVLLLHE